MTVAGIDVGSLTAKSVVLNDGRIIAQNIIRTGPDSHESAQATLSMVLSDAGLKLSDLKYIIATGYGRRIVPFANETVTEITCHARGTVKLFPLVRLILDLGGQDCKVIKCGPQGKIIDFVMNDKCAAGTGRYLERIASVLGIALEQIGPRSLAINSVPVKINSTCTVFAETEVICNIREGKHPNDILAGACEAICQRILPYISRLGFAEQFSISGGVAKNVGVVERLEQILKTEARIAPEPQIIGALGAALIAEERLAGQ